MTEQSDEEIKAAIFRLLKKRQLASTICPSEVARSFSSKEAEWRPLMVLMSLAV